MTDTPITPDTLARLKDPDAIIEAMARAILVTMSKDSPCLSDEICRGLPCACATAVAKVAIDASGLAQLRAENERLGESASRAVGLASSAHARAKRAESSLDRLKMAAQKVYAGLDARIELVTGRGAIAPLYHGMADLHDALSALAHQDTDTREGEGR